MSAASARRADSRDSSVTSRENTPCGRTGASFSFPGVQEERRKRAVATLTARHTIFRFMRVSLIVTKSFFCFYDTICPRAPLCRQSLKQRRSPSFRNGTRGCFLRWQRVIPWECHTAWYFPKYASGEETGEGR